MKRRVKSAIQNLEYRFKASSWCSTLLDSVLWIVPRRTPDESFHFLLPFPGNGNIGDEAMTESFINYVGVDCVLIVEDRASFLHKHQNSPVPMLIEIPHLIHGNFLQNLVALISFLKISHKVKTFSVIGADIMDGVYNVEESLNRLFLLRVINSLKIDTRIIGFSWSSTPNPTCTNLMRIISDQTKLCVRDPKSAQRLKAHQIFATTETADVVFSDESVDTSALAEMWVPLSTKPIIIVNISGLGLNTRDEYFEHIRHYSLIIKHLQMKGYRILILPHVFRVADGDLESSSDLFKSSCRSEDLLITEPLSPSQERDLFKSVSFVITGRMHIAILALNVGRPVIAIESMGKVQGLFEMFDLEQYCVNRDRDLANNVIRVIDTLEIELSSVCALIQSKIPEIRQRSLLNFAGLN